MRLNHLFIPCSSIIVDHANFETTLLPNDLSSLKVALVDVFMKEVRLRLAMYSWDAEIQQARFEGSTEKSKYRIYYIVYTT